MTTERELQLLTMAYQAGISSPTELAIFMAQVTHESGDLKRMDEGFRYTKGINQITRAGVASALREGPEALEAARLEALRGKPQKLAELMYGGRMGNDQPGDGFKYHGRGYIQLTGKNQYEHAGRALGLDLVNNPGLATQPECAAKIAIWYWKTNVPPNARESLTRAGGSINTGNADKLPNQQASRLAKYERWEGLLTLDVVEGLSKGEVRIPGEVGDRFAIAPMIQSIQQNLNTMGITDARGQSLVVDGNRGGPGSRTNQAIAAFQHQFGMTGEMSSSQLLSATAVVLRTRQTLDFDQSLRDILPETMQQSPSPRTASGVADYLLHGRDVSDRVAASAMSPRNRAPTPAHAESSALRPLSVTRNLRPGDQGEGVLALQDHLRALGARDRQGREIESDRAYGPRTRGAVEQFQLWTGREPTGIADAQTLQDLQVHARHAALQRANGIAASDHLSDNLMHAPVDLADAAVLRPVQGRGISQMPVRNATSSATLMPYSDPTHPKHQLYSELKGALESMGRALPEDRLHQVTGKMDLNGLRAGPQNRYVFSNDNTTLHVVSDIPGFRAHQSLEASAPAVAQTMQQVQAEQVTRVEGLERMIQMPRAQAPSAGPTMGGH